MRVLITYGSKRGGTQGIAEVLADELRSQGVQVDLLPPRQALRHKLDVEGVIIGGALYANRWHSQVRRFVARREKQLQTLPVWLFSSGPLDDSAEDHPIQPVPQVSVLMERIGAVAHVTFGGRLEPNATGFPANAMAKKSSGDWRHPEHIRSWAVEIARALPRAHPREPVVHPGHALPRLVFHGVLGWALCASVMVPLLAFAQPWIAFLVHGLLAPIFFGVVAWHYFKARGARNPLPTALIFTGTVLALDGVVALAQRSFAMFTSVAGFWLPVTAIFFVTWAVGAMMSMMPFPRDTLVAKTH